MKKTGCYGLLLACTGVQIRLLHFPWSHAWAVLRPCILYKITLDASCLDYVVSDSSNLMHSLREISQGLTWVVLLGACDGHSGAGAGHPFSFLSFPY